MRFVAVAAGHPGRKHLALFERAVVVDLVEHLPVGMIEPASEGRDHVGVGQGLSGNPVLREFSASRVAEPAGLDLPARWRRGDIAMWIAGFGIRLPANAVSLVQKNGKPFARILVLSKPVPLAASPIYVSRAFAVARLATDADFRPNRVEAITGRIVVFLHTGRVALGAHEIPVLIELGPVQYVVVLDLFIGIKMKPALTALLPRPAVPGNRKRLYPAIGKFDQILLQGINAERVLHLEGRKFAVGAVGLDEKLAISLEEAGMDAEIVEARIVKIAKHGGGIGVLHGMLVLGFFPQRGFGLVAPSTGFAADEGERRGSAAGTKRFGQDESALGDKHYRQCPNREGHYRRQRGYSRL